MALPGGRTLDEYRRVVEEAIREKNAGEDQWVWVRDVAPEEWVVYELDSTKTDGGRMACYKAPLTVSDSGTVTVGDPVEVEAKTTYETVSESTRQEGRVLESKGTDDKGGRVYRVRIIESGKSKNKRYYPKRVLEAAKPLYEGAKAYDHHRTLDELTTSTINGLVGSYRNVEAADSGLDADLHLLPSATHTAEALDASLEAQAQGLPPLVGISHDVLSKWRPLVLDGQQFKEATEIFAVNSADVVADPAAGGRATRMVAGGSDDPDSPEGTMTTIEELLQLINGATPEQRAAALEGLGISATDLAKLAANDPPADPPVVEDPKELVPAGATESSYAKDSLAGRSIVRMALKEANLDERFAESLVLPDRFTEADIDSAVKTIQRVTESLEKTGLTPSVPDIKVTTEERDNKVKALDAMFDGNFKEGYRSLKQAFIDVTGYDVRKAFLGEEDFNRVILKESMGNLDYDSQRSTESVDTSTWAQIMGDSITRRMVKEYSLQQLSSWRRIVSSIVPVNDFREQKIDRLGGYGTLPTVLQGAPYQPLTTPGDEEATYTLSKKGGLEELTLESIANDDLRAITRIPAKLGRAAAQTLFRFVWDFLLTNPTLTYDSVALFAAGHANTDTGAALSQSTLSTGRRKMRKQAAYGDSVDILSIVPRFLVVPSELEEIAFQLSTSAVAIPASGNDTNIPNLHQGIEPIVLDHATDANDWFLVADPEMTPTMEVGFYQGREEPELFVQNDPTVGSSFSADKVTYKVRHIYSGTWLDHRSAYRGQG